MARFNVTYPRRWNVNNFTPVDMVDNHGPSGQLKRHYFVDNGRGEVCGVYANYLGTMCINEVYLSKGQWHLSTRATYTLNRDQLQELLDEGKIDLPWGWGDAKRTIQMRLITEEEAKSRLAPAA